jgi:uncharacterized protein DUF4389
VVAREVRAYAYLLLLTGKYPPFGLLDDDYPVSVTISPGRLNRAAVLFRLVLVIPAWVVVTILWYGLGPVLMIPTWLIVLVLGRMPQPLHEAIAASLRYWARVKAYWYLLTGVYPGGLFGDAAEPAPGTAGPSATWATPGTGPAALSAAPDIVPAATWAAPDATPATAWATPDLGGQIPLDPGSAPAGQPVPLPAEAVLRPAPPAAAAVPGRLVLSRPGKRLVGLILAIGAATPVALFVLLAALAPPAAPAPGSVAAAAVAPSASAGPVSASSDPPPRPIRQARHRRRPARRRASRPAPPGG